MTQSTDFKVPVLVFGDDLEPVLQRDVDVLRHSPLPVEECGAVLRPPPVIPQSRGHVLIETIGTFGKETFAIEGGVVRVRITPKLVSTLREEVLTYWVRCIKG